MTGALASWEGDLGEVSAFPILIPRVNLKADAGQEGDAPPAGAKAEPAYCLMCSYQGPRLGKG